MATMPKRRKSKDNPYVLNYDVERKVFLVSFKDAANKQQNLPIPEGVFKAFNRFELEDISQLHKIDKYLDKRSIDNSEYSEIVLYHNIFEMKSVLEEVEEKIQNEELHQAIKKLSIIQQKRIKMYYFEEMTLKQIAEIEHCSIMSVKESIDSGINKLRKILKKTN